MTHTKPSYWSQTICGHLVSIAGRNPDAPQGNMGITDPRTHVRLDFGPWIQLRGVSQFEARESIFVCNTARQLQQLFSDWQKP